MSQRHPLLTRWGELGEKLAYALPLQTFERLVTALGELSRADLGTAVDCVSTLLEMASSGRSSLTLEELIALIESRVAEARAHPDLTRPRPRGRS